MLQKPHPITAWLARSPTWVFTTVASLAAFSTYFAMYAFRKPFAAGAYKETFDLHFAQIELKDALVLSQLFGYTLSKFLGIKICSEAAQSRRALFIIGLIVAAEAALVLFGALPPQWKVLAIFLNGVPLGMIWGLVVWYLEGRRTTDILVAALSCSFVVSSGWVKGTGLWLMQDAHVPEEWMPAATGLCFLPLLLLSVWMLSRLPPPNAADIAARVRREPMRGADRMAFLRQFMPGMILLCAVYFFLTACRDYRDNYQVDVLKTLGYGKQLVIVLNTSETVVGFGVALAMAALFLVRDNRQALWCAFAIMLLGTILVGASTLLLDFHLISGLAWMVLIGLGTYLAYLPYNTLLFERITASARWVGTAVFGISLADATGYTGSALVQLYKVFAGADMDRLRFLRAFSYCVSVVGTVCMLATWWYFARRLSRTGRDQPPQMRQPEVHEPAPVA